MANNNLYKIEGVIYSKPVRTAPDKKGKNGGVPYEFPSIILEVKREYREKTYTTLPEFELGRGVNTEDFSVGDKVEITFALEGKKISDTFHKTTPKAIYLRHTEVDYNDSKDVDRQETKRETVFVPPAPDSESEEESDLPF
jgi:hypothetical protein